MGEPLWGLAQGKLAGPSHGLWCVVCWDRSLGWKRLRQPTSQRHGGRASAFPALRCRGLSDSVACGRLGWAARVGDSVAVTPSSEDAASEPRGPGCIRAALRGLPTPPESATPRPGHVQRTELAPRLTRVIRHHAGGGGVQGLQNSRFHLRAEMSSLVTQPVSCFPSSDSQASFLRKYLAGAQV